MELDVARKSSELRYFERLLRRNMVIWKWARGSKASEIQSCDDWWFSSVNLNRDIEKTKLFNNTTS